MVAPASRGSPPASLPSAASSACTAGSPPSRENPRDSSAPSAPTTTAPTENAICEGRHSHATATATRIHPASSTQPILTRRPARAVNGRDKAKKEHLAERIRAMPFPGTAPWGRPKRYHWHAQTAITKSGQKPESHAREYITRIQVRVMSVHKAVAKRRGKRRLRKLRRS